MRVTGLDIHRAFAEAVAWDDGELKRLGRVDMRRHVLEAFAKKLAREDVVVVEAEDERLAVERASARVRSARRGTSRSSSVISPVQPWRTRAPNA